MARWIGFVFACSSLVIGATLLWTTAGYPQTGPCLPLKLAEQAVAEQHGEVLFAVGRLQGRMMRLYANRDTRSWTAMSVDPNRVACVVGSGTDLQFVKPKAGASS